MTPAIPTVTEPALRQFITDSFIACGLPATDAEIAGSLMAQADLMGQDGHGVFRLPQYVRRIRDVVSM